MADESSTGTGSETSLHPGNPKYGLRPRSIINRIETERRRQQEQQPVKEKKVKAEPKSKSKHRPPPLSKYRRKNANARERHRMHEINMAFEALRKAIPSFPAGNAKQNESQLTKITTLKLAMNYIRALSEMLKDDEQGSSSSPGPQVSIPDVSTVEVSSSIKVVIVGSDSPSVSTPDSSGSSITFTQTFSPDEPSSSSSSWSPCYQNVLCSPHASKILLGRDNFLTPSPTPSPESSVDSRARQTGPLPPVETLLQRTVDLGPPSDCLSDFLPDDDPTVFGDVFDSFAPLADFSEVAGSSLDILLESDGESLTLSSDFSDQPTP
jgi:bHLH factor